MKPSVLTVLLLVLLLVNLVYIVDFTSGVLYSLIMAATGIFLLNYAYVLYHRRTSGVGGFIYFSGIYFTYGIITYLGVDGRSINVASLVMLLVMLTLKWDPVATRRLISPLQPIALFLSIFMGILAGCRDPLWFAVLALIDSTILELDFPNPPRTPDKVNALLSALILYTFPYSYTGLFFPLVSLIIFMFKSSSLLRNHLGSIIGIDIVLRPLVSVIRL